MPASGLDPLPVSADVAARAVADAAALLASGTAGRFEAGEGALLWLSGAALPALNGVIAWDARAAVAEVERLLDDAVAAGVPHSLQLRPTAGPRLTALAERRGMRLVEHTPLMLASADALRSRDVPRLRIRRLTPDEVHLHVDLVAQGFEMPPDEIARVTTSHLLETPGVSAYVGERDGAAVCTALAVRTGAAVGVLNVATPPRHRRRGSGAALTAAAVAGAQHDGATWAWLQSSHLGYGAYARLSFREAESWPFWVSA